MQVDAIALATKGTMGQFAMMLLEEGLADCIASDNHGDVRSLAMARDWLVSRGLEELATLLTDVNPRRLLANQPVLPVPPMRQRRGLWRRLGEMFGARGRWGA